MDYLDVLSDDNGLVEEDNTILTDDNLPEGMSKEYADGKGED